MAKAANKTPVKKTEAFCQDSADFALLVTKFQNGEILPTEKPASARNRFEVFQKYTPDQFRAQYSKAKTLSGVMGKCTYYKESVNILFFSQRCQLQGKQKMMMLLLWLLQHQCSRP